MTTLKQFHATKEPHADDCLCPELEQLLPGAQPVYLDGLHPMSRRISAAEPVLSTEDFGRQLLATEKKELADLEADALGIELDVKKVERICELIRAGTPRMSAARMVGLTPTRLTALLKMGNQPPSKVPLIEERRVRMSQALQEIRAAEAELESLLGSTVVSLAVGKYEQDDEGRDVEIRPPDLQAAKFVLQTRFPKNWSTKTEIKHEGTIAHQHQHQHKLEQQKVVNVKDLSDEDLDMLEAMVVRKETDRPALTHVQDATFEED